MSMLVTGANPNLDGVKRVERGIFLAGRFEERLDALVVALRTSQDCKREVAALKAVIGAPGFDPSVQMPRLPMSPMAAIVGLGNIDNRYHSFFNEAPILTVAESLKHVNDSREVAEGLIIDTMRSLGGVQCISCSTVIPLIQRAEDLFHSDHKYRRQLENLAIPLEKLVLPNTQDPLHVAEASAAISIRLLDFVSRTLGDKWNPNQKYICGVKKETGEVEERALLLLSVNPLVSSKLIDLGARWERYPDVSKRIAKLLIWYHAVDVLLDDQDSLAKRGPIDSAIKHIREHLSDIDISEFLYRGTDDGSLLSEIFEGSTLPGLKMELLDVVQKAGRDAAQSILQTMRHGRNLLSSFVYSFTFQAFDGEFYTPEIIRDCKILFARLLLCGLSPNSMMLPMDEHPNGGPSIKEWLLSEREALIEMVAHDRREEKLSGEPEFDAAYNLAALDLLNSFIKMTQLKFPALAKVAGQLVA